MRYKQLTLAEFNFPYARMGGTMLGTNNSGNPNVLRRADGTIEELTNEHLQKAINMKMGNMQNGNN